MVELLEPGAAGAQPAPPIPAGTITLGLEEELLVVDVEGALAAHDFARGQRDVPDSDGTSSRELHLCALEIKTPVCLSADAIVASLAAMRGVAARRAALQGQRVLSAGVHPFSPWMTQPTYDDPVAFPRYVRMQREYGDVVRGALAFGMHVHLACTDPALRMPVMNALRNVLPDALALSASSPFAQGRDTGMASWRHSILGRLPRSGVPDVWRDEAAYTAHLERLRAVGSLRAGEGLWEDLRLHHVYGTLEVRICDAAPSMDRIWLIVALLQAEVATLEDEVRRGGAPEPVARALLEDNKFRACRHGMDAELVDWRTGVAAPMSARLHQWLQRVAPAAARLGTLPRLATALSQALAEGASATQQRAWAQDGGFGHVVDRLVDATARPLSAGLLPRAARAHERRVAASRRSFRNRRAEGGPMSPLHPLSFALRADDGTRARLAAGVHRALGEPEAAMPPRYIGEAPLVMSERLHAEVTRRTEMLRDWVFAQHAAGRWRDDPLWGDIGPPDCLCADLAIVRDDAAPGGWGVRWVEFQTFLSIAATVHGLHVAASAEWPELAALRHWDPSPRFGDDWLAASRHWMAPHADGILLEHAPRAQGSAFDLYGSGRLWGLDVVATADVRIRDDVLQARVDGAWRDVPYAASRLILLEEDDPTATARDLSRARLAWRNHPAWFDRVHKGVLPELPLAPEERCALAAHWRTLDVPAERLVLKAVDSWGGADVKLDVDAAHLDGLADPRRWMVQPRFDALPLLAARDGAPLFGELRVMMALEPDGGSWVAARMARISRGPMASAAHWAERPGEGIVPLYVPPGDDGSRHAA